MEEKKRKLQEQKAKLAKLLNQKITNLEFMDVETNHIDNKYIDKLFPLLDQMFEFEGSLTQHYVNLCFA